MVSIILSLLGFASTLYFLVYILCTGNNNLFTYFWLLLGILLTGAALLYYIIQKRQIVIPKPLLAVFYTVTFTGCFIIAITEFTIIVNGFQKPEPGADYVIVLGARVNGTKVSRNLKYRLDSALDYIKNNPGCKIVVTGGQGKGEDITEGQAMKDYLVQNGADPGIILKEEKSKNTEQNFKYSMDIIKDKSAKVVIVSNNFHIYRAKRIALKQGYENVSGTGARTVAFTVPNCYLREAFAVIKYKIYGQI
ncbi:MAG: YdcF family protein [Lachnospiraceae bacterium]|nr:YdcF family protein [Lachnospiraceae bacterium]